MAASSAAAAAAVTAVEDDAESGKSAKKRRRGDGKDDGDGSGVSAVARAALRTFQLCNVEGCDNPKNVCRGCHRSDGAKCAEHVDPAVYMQHGPFMIHRSGPMQYQYCMTLFCTTCWTAGPVVCAGPGARQDGRECPHLPEDGGDGCTRCSTPVVGPRRHGCICCSTTCATCRDWIDTSRCDECFDEYAHTHTCTGCDKVRDTLWTCHGRTACYICMPAVQVDVSPMTLFPGTPQFAVGHFMTLCKDCLDKTSVEEIQDKARLRMRQEQRPMPTGRVVDR